MSTKHSNPSKSSHASKPEKYSDLSQTSRDNLFSSLSPAVSDANNIALRLRTALASLNDALHNYKYQNWDSFRFACELSDLQHTLEDLSPRAFAHSNHLSSIVNDITFPAEK